MAEETADFVVVGAGSAGCAVAARLSENGRYSVALLEAGPPDRSLWIHLPIGYGKTMWDKRLNWAFHTEPEPNMDGRRIYWPRGKTLGGSSSINGLIAIRGQHEDYDAWQALGCRGWSWSDVFPYFRKLETALAHPHDQSHGASGPLTVSPIPKKHELIEAAIDAAQKLGVPRTADFNGDRQEGAGYFELTTRNGLRVSAAKAYLAPARGRANLRIIADAQAAGVDFEGLRACAVRYRRSGADFRISARRGIVLSAGALQSPQLLMLSGIGPATHLKEKGVPVLLDRAGVGANLQDHLQFRLIYRCTKPITTNDQLATFLGRMRIGAQWLFTRGGPLAIGINQGGIFARVLPESNTPDIQFHIATLSADMAGAKPHPFSGFTLSVCQLRPESRGHIELDSNDPFAAPKMFANYLDAAIDRRCAVAAISFARKLAQTAPLSELVAEEIKPGPLAKTDADLLAFARATGATIFHPAGTCRMGDDAAAVVDPDLRVRGVDGLWIADCSIMPRLVSGNTNLPAIMIGERAADKILAEAAEH
ncbi:MAG: GMC family oxidoreductase N-terminal domain-containing protein [Hyphomicrobiales bacterium]|nr:GMC family oxidoreductase N-terminal domain-containing protein [Hyphomicrobiales bacterium]